MRAEFFERVKNSFPPERIINSKKDLNNLVANCTATAHTPLLSIQVINQAEIIQILSWANEYQIAVYPVSTGHNWGYGSRSPYKENSLLIDLSRMNRIIAFNEKTGVVTVEPGVTQKQLFDFLTERKAPFLTPTTGAGPKASLLGNALEHGFGLTPEADHCLAIMNLEAILPDGRNYRSDFAENGAHDLDRNFKWSLGPYFDGIFTQSNFGIVTSMTIALAYRPSEIAAFYFTLKSESYFEMAVESIQQIMQRHGAYVAGINLMNASRVVSMIQKSPSEKALTSAQQQSLKSDLSISDWTGVGTLYCEKEVSKAIKKQIKKNLSPFCRQIVFVNRQKILEVENLLRYFPRFIFGPILSHLSKVKESLDIFEGHPSAAALPLVYWRSKQNPVTDATKIDPDKGDVGLIWYAPVIVADTKKVTAMVELITEICAKNNMDPLITLTAFNSRVFDITLPLLFNRNDETQIKNAYQCYNELFQAGNSIGSRPYRIGVQSSDAAISENNFWALQKKIKQALDPNNILAPGRYSKN